MMVQTVQVVTKGLIGAFTDGRRVRPSDLENGRAERLMFVKRRRRLT